MQSCLLEWLGHWFMMNSDLGVEIPQTGLIWPWMAWNELWLMWLAWLTWHWRGFDIKSYDIKSKTCYHLYWKATNSKHSQWDNYKILFRILLVLRFLDQDHIWWKDLIFSSEMFLDTGYWSKVFDWQFFHLIIYVLPGHKNKFL